MSSIVGLYHANAQYWKLEKEVYHFGNLLDGLHRILILV